MLLVVSFWAAAVFSEQGPGNEEQVAGREPGEEVQQELGKKITWRLIFEKKKKNKQ